MPTTILDGEAYPEALHRRYAEEAKAEERMKTITLTEEQAQQIENALFVHGHAYLGHDEEYAEALTVIRAARAQGRVEQEPVARVPAHPEQGLEWLKPPPAWGSLLYAAPVQQVDLTDDEVFELIQRHRVGDMSAAHGLVRAVIAADREKNK